MGPSPCALFVAATKREKPQDLELAIALDPDMASEVEGPSGNPALGSHCEFTPEPLHGGVGVTTLLSGGSLLFPKTCCRSASGRGGASLPRSR